MEKGDLLGGAYKKVDSAPESAKDQVKIGQESMERKKHTYAGIMQERSKNEEYMTGKRFAKARGSMGKLHKKGKSKKKKFKKK